MRPSSERSDIRYTELHDDRVAQIQIYPRPIARMCEMSKEGMKTLRISAEKMPPFFMTPLFLILRDTERRGCLKWNSLRRRGINQPVNAKLSQKTTEDEILKNYLLSEWLWEWESAHFGGMFSGLLDQSATQSTSLLIRMSSSRSFSTQSSSDCEKEGKAIKF